MTDGRVMKFAITILVEALCFALLCLALPAKAEDSKTVEKISPMPLLKILEKEESRTKKNIHVVSITYIDSNEIVVMYLHYSGCLNTVVYREGDEKKLANQLYQYDSTIPRKEIRQYYMQNAPTAKFLLEKLEQREQKFKERQEKKANKL